MADPLLPSRVDRRRFMGYFAAIGLGGTALPATLWAAVQQAREITKGMLADAEAVAGLSFTDDERELMLEGLNDNLEAYQRLRETPIDNMVHPAVIFDPVLPGRTMHPLEGPSRRRRATVTRPENLEEVAFWQLTEMGELLRTGQVASVELTEMYLGRLRRHGPKLECVITLTPELALKQARRADAEIARGYYRGPLHGVPWGAKDLLAEDEYRTTWGAKPFEDQQIPYDATVVERLEAAGAVLVAKLTLGALAWGDVWFGGTTKNPWKPDQGSSGSSAGSASATVAGLVGFSIGSETLGSIVSPSTRCGASGLRPTFGRVSRYGAMALSWSMDKLGPICRSVEDCALVFEAIHGADGKDPSARTLPFRWDPRLPLSEIRIGYYQSAFEREPQDDNERRQVECDRRALAQLRALGIDPIPVEVPGEFPVGALSIILNAEAAAAFSDLTLSDRDDLLVRQVQRAWPNSFRQARFIPAVEYLQANRVRTIIMGAMESVMDGVDVFMTPSYGPRVLLTTNLTGHPAVTVPHGFGADNTPSSISFVGKLFGESELVRVAHAYQAATDFHTRRPPEFA